MALIRRLVRGSMLFGWFFILTVWVALVNRRKGWDGVAKAAEWTRLWARGSAWIANHRITVYGDPDAFQGGLIVGNHQGYLDIVAHASTFCIRFAPKKEIRSWPFLGFMIGLNRPVWIDRKSRQKSKETAEEMVETMRNGIAMLVYPEGTSTDGMHGLLPFKSTPFEAAAELSLPIQPTLLFYEGVPKQTEPLAWYGEQKLLPHIWRILGLKEIRMRVYILPIIRPEPGEDRKALARRVHDMMEKEYWRVKDND